MPPLPERTAGEFPCAGHRGTARRRGSRRVSVSLRQMRSYGEHRAAAADRESQGEDAADELPQERRAEREWDDLKEADERVRDRPRRQHDHREGGRRAERAPEHSLEEEWRAN